MYVLLLEWDGKKPPTTWYKRLHKLGLFVRGDMEKSPIERRSSARTNIAFGESRVIVQESTVVCASYSLARELAHLAISMNAKVVQLGEGDFTFSDDIRMTDADAVVFQRVQAILGKTGRPSSLDNEVCDWAVTCLEEAATHDIIQEKYVLTCPRCGALLIKTRPGNPKSYSITAGESNMNTWLRTRFATGGFEVPTISNIATKPPLAKIPGEKREVDARQLILASNAFITNINALPIGHALKCLDAVFCARAYSAKERRQQKRLRVIASLLDAGCDPASLSLSEKPNQVDMLDTAAIMSEIDAMALYRMTTNGQNKP